VERIFYDGHCGLCHGWVRFTLARDRDGRAFRFAPLQGPTFAAAVPEAVRTGLPDSIVVQREDGALLTRSAAVLHVLRRLGGGWRVLATVGAALPGPLRDAAYDGLARVRGRLARRPPDVCPLLPLELRDRFDP
jgi:predicted DCC family thiol-disulfide oxidoreductase YuxK